MSQTTSNTNKSRRILTVVGSVILSAIALNISGIDKLIDKFIVVDKHTEKHEYYYPSTPSKDSSQPSDVPSERRTNRFTSDSQPQQEEITRTQSIPSRHPDAEINRKPVRISPSQTNESFSEEKFGIYDLKKFKQDSLSEREKRKFKKENN